MSDEMKPREFYLPHKPITYAERTRVPMALPFFYTNTTSLPMVVFAVYRLAQFSVVDTNSDLLPTTETCFKVVYKKAGQTNCEGVSRYELTEQSRNDLLSEQRKILAEIDGV